MTRSILTVPFAFLINVSSLILSWLLILPFPTHCTKVKDTVHYYTVTYMLLIWRRLNDLFSYKNIVNSNSQYLALRHVLYIYRDGIMALARTSGQVLANPDNMAVFCSGRKQLELQKTMADLPALECGFTKVASYCERNWRIFLMVFVPPSTGDVPNVSFLDGFCTSVDRRCSKCFIFGWFLYLRRQEMFQMFQMFQISQVPNYAPGGYCRFFATRR